MATLIAADIVGFAPGANFNQHVADYERMVIEANRRLAEHRIVRIDRQPSRDPVLEAKRAEKQS